MWFDSSINFANIAKNALKEAQKKIDKALDIQEEQIEEPKSKSETNTPLEVKAKNNSIWGSFNGSFFDNSIVNSPLVTQEQPRKSETSSESLDILSLPSPSTLPTPTDSETVQDESSVEIVDHPSDVDLSSPDEFHSTNINSPESVEVITEDSDDLINRNSSSPITIAPSRSGLHLSLSKTSNFESINLQDPSDSIAILSSSDHTLTTSETESFYDTTKEDLEQTLKIDPNYMEKSMESFEIQTQVSDSTHSFEEISSKAGSNEHPSKSKTCPKKSTGSGTTSGDELETGTSSDIEIISSPGNGDSSSSVSFNKVSPSKVPDSFPYKNSELCLADLRLEVVTRKPGHSRELSEGSVLSDDSNISETERLLKKISELSEVLEQREYKLVQLGRLNAELTDNNSQLLGELENYKKKRNSMDISNVQEEYTQRLSALEKKFQQTIRENTAIKKLNETLRSDLQSKISRDDHERKIAEKDGIIDTLKLEGEKLSKQILQLNTIIKKLRSKTKEDDEIMKKQDTQIQELTEENKNLKKSLAAKEEIEKSQGEGITKLTTDKRKFEKENQTLKSELEDLEQKFQALQTSYDALKKEMSDKNVEFAKNLEEEKDKVETENKQILKELQDMKLRMRETELTATTREQKMMQENLELKRKLEETEFRIEDQQQAASLAAIPLIRQLESLQSTLNSRTLAWENQEKTLLDKLEESQDKLKAQTEIEKSAKDQVINLNLKIANIEEKLSFTSLKLEETSGQLQQKQIEFELKENEYKKRLERNSKELDQKLQELEQLKKVVSDLEEKLRIERENHEEEKRKFTYIQHHHHHHQTHEPDANNQLEQSFENASPTLSLGEESLHSNQWNVDDIDVGGSIYGSSQYGGIALQSSTSLMESLQSVLKQRDGETQQLQWELNRLQTERNFLSNELSNLTAELEKANEAIKCNTELEENFNELKSKYESLLEMHGSKIEEYEELKLDLDDVKDMYKIQIDDLLLQINNLKKNS